MYQEQKAGDSRGRSRREEFLEPSLAYCGERDKRYTQVHSCVYVYICECTHTWKPKDNWVGQPLITFHLLFKSSDWLRSLPCRSSCDFSIDLPVSVCNSLSGTSVCVWWYWEENTGHHTSGQAVYWPSCILSPTVDYFSRSLVITFTGLELTVQVRLPLNLWWSSCVCFANHKIVLCHTLL